MVNRVRMVSHGIVVIIFLALFGCTPPAATKPDMASSSSGSQTSDGGSSSGMPSSSTRESPAPSSLEALRRGDSTATPASSPLKDIYFDFDRYDLRADARDVLKANADWLKRNASARIEIEGHCDERGTNEYNLALGAKRAQSAKDYLITLGISAEQLSTISYGEEVPVCKENSEGCWQKNRRARFVIIPGRPAS
jgi:peptidoglycan-associated lipoprotein